MKIKELRFFDLAEFVNIASKQCWYDQDNNNENFNKILEFMSNNKPTKENLYIIAKDIINNTTIDFEINYDQESYILDTMKYIFDTCVNVNFIKGSEKA